MLVIPIISLIFFRWRNCCSMNTPRSRAAAGVIDGNIYVVGGANGYNCLTSVEWLEQKNFNSLYNFFLKFIFFCSFNAQENFWQFVSPMSTPRIGLTCVVVNRLMYAIGNSLFFCSFSMYKPSLGKSE